MFSTFQLKALISRNDRLPRCCPLVQQPGGVCLVLQVSSSSTRKDARPSPRPTHTETGQNARPAERQTERQGGLGSAKASAEGLRRRPSGKGTRSRTSHETALRATSAQGP